MAQSRLPGIDGVPDQDDLGPDSWATPPKLLEAAYEVLGSPVGLDPCSNARSLVAARVRWTIRDDALSKTAAEWAAHGTIWLNPPYSNPEPFLARLADAASLGARGVALVKHDHATAWWRLHCAGRPLLMLAHRVKFLGGPGSPPWPSTMVFFGVGCPVSLGRLGDVRG